MLHRCRTRSLDTSHTRMRPASLHARPADYPDFPSGQQMCAYLRNYAQHFKVRSPPMHRARSLDTTAVRSHCRRCVRQIREHISFKAKVVSVKPSSDDQWTLEFADGSRKTYGGVIVATGHHWDCRWGGPYEGTFTGTTMHSKVRAGRVSLPTHLPTRLTRCAGVSGVQALQPAGG